MTPLKFKGLGPESQAFTVALREKYPKQKTHSSRLFQEAVHGDSLRSRSHATMNLCFMGYRRGFKAFRRIIEDFEAKWVATGFDSHNLWSVPVEVTAEANFVADVLLLFGMMNTAGAHALICQIYETSPCARLRASAVDAMGYEEDFFDRNIILRILKQEQEHELFRRCALWVFMMKLCQVPDSYRLRVKYVAPLLADHSSQVRMYAVDALIPDRRFANAIRPLLNDPDLQTADAARHALETMEGCDE